MKEVDSHNKLATPPGIIALICACLEQISAADRKKKIEKLMTAFAWHEHYRDKSTGRRVLSESNKMQFVHELTTAKLLCQNDFDVIFTPKGMFTRKDKKFDILLITDTHIFKADLKCITSKNPDTIAKGIKHGSEQASRLVIHINSDIHKRDLLSALRSGVKSSSLIDEILLFYRGKLHRLRKSKIMSEDMYNLLK